MGLVRGFFRETTPPRLLALAGLALLCLSQFFAYFETPGAGFSSFERDAGAAPGLWDGLPVTGWELHPQAIPIQTLLVAFFLVRDVAEHPLFRRFGYWVALVLILASMSPGAPTRAAGAALGSVAFLMVLVAAIWQQLLPRMSVPPAAASTPPDA